MNKLLPILVLLVAVNCFGATYYVATNGNDTASGTSLNTAWQTIQHGLNSVSPGDTLIVTNGYFSEASPYTAINGTPTQPITIKAANFGFNQTPLTNGFYIQHQWYIIEGFTFVLGGNFGFGANQSLGIFGTNANHNLVYTNFYTTQGMSSFANGNSDAIAWYDTANATNVNQGGSYNTILSCVFTNIMQSNNVDEATIGVHGVANLIISNQWWNIADMDICDFFGYSNRLCWGYATNVSQGWFNTNASPIHTDTFQTFGNLNVNTALATYNSEDHMQEWNCTGITAYIDSDESGQVGTNYVYCNLYVQTHGWGGTGGVGGTGSFGWVACPQVRASGSYIYVLYCDFICWSNAQPVIHGLNQGLPAGIETNMTVYGDIVYEYDSVGGGNGNAIGFDAGTSNNVSDYLFVTTTGGNPPQTIYPPGTHWITNGYPGFIQTNQSFSLNYTLTNTSRCIAYGTNLTAWATAMPQLNVDLAGNTRSATANWDLGVFAFIPSTNPNEIDLGQGATIKMGAGATIQVTPYLWTN